MLRSLSAWRGLSACLGELLAKTGIQSKQAVGEHRSTDSPVARSVESRQGSQLWLSGPMLSTMFSLN
jgi:hypothetical protein